MLAELDHIILGINDLESGVAWVEERTGVRAAFGGVHPGRGPRNALLALGPSCYLEIIAPDPQQSAPTWFASLRTMSEPRLMGWAAHTSDLTALAQAVVEAGFAISEPQEGARSRPDGRVLTWKLFHLRHDRGGLLPFFIEWARDAVHPAKDAPSGCGLKSFYLESPKAREWARMCRMLGVDVQIQAGDKLRLLARLAGPKGEVELTS